jgi:hypothetical protein
MSWENILKGTEFSVILKRKGTQYWSKPFSPVRQDSRKEAFAHLKKFSKDRQLEIKGDDNEGKLIGDEEIYYVIRQEPTKNPHYDYIPNVIKKERLQ